MAWYTDWNGNEFFVDEGESQFGGQIPQEGYTVPYTAPDTPWDSFNNMPEIDTSWIGSLGGEGLEAQRAYTNPSYMGTVAPGGYVENAISSDLLGGIGDFLNSKAGGYAIQGISGLLSTYLNARSIEERQSSKQQIQEAVTRQGWAPELVNRLMGALDQYSQYMTQIPAPGMTEQQRAYWDQMANQLQQQGALPGDLAARQALFTAMQGSMPYQQYGLSQGLMSNYLNQAPEQAMDELTKQWGAFAHHGLAQDQVIRGYAQAKLDATQRAAEMERLYGGMFQQGAQQIGGMAPTYGATYPGMGNISNYLGFMGAPKTQVMADVTGLQPIYGQYPQLVAQGLNIGMTPSTSSRTMAGSAYGPTGSSAWYSGLANAIGNIARDLSTTDQKQTQAQAQATAKP